MKRAVPKDKMKEPQPMEEDTTKVFVGGLSPDTTKKDVEEALAKYGIVSAKIMTHMGSEKPRGFAFAYFDTVKSAQTVAKIKWFKILVSALVCM